MATKDAEEVKVPAPPVTPVVATTGDASTTVLTTETPEAPPINPGYLVINSVHYTDKDGKDTTAEAGSVVKWLPPSSVAWLALVGHVIPLHGVAPEQQARLQSERMAGVMDAAAREAADIADRKADLARQEAANAEAIAALEAQAGDLDAQRKAYLEAELAKLQSKGSES